MLLILAINTALIDLMFAVVTALTDFKLAGPTPPVISISFTNLNNFLFRIISTRTFTDVSIR